MRPDEGAKRDRDGQVKKREMRDKGFTLIEVLVAMMIMIMIVLMLSAVFKQMTSAWGVGMRKVKVTMEGRAALDFMAQELVHAVSDDLLICNIRPANDISFYTFNSLSNRAVCHVRYSLTGRTLERYWRPMKWDCQGSYPAPEGAYTHELLNDVVGFDFYTSDGGTYTTNLPDWVDIVMKVEQNDRVSRVTAKSAGPDRQIGTVGDNIRSEE